MNIAISNPIKGVQHIGQVYNELVGATIEAISTALDEDHKSRTLF